MSATVTTPPAIVFDGIQRGFFGVPVLKDVSFALPAGHVLGLVGENGAGKSTLMNILGGVLAPDAGSMHLHGAALRARRRRRGQRARGIAFIHQELNLFTNLSIAENLVIDGFPRLGRTPLIDRKAVREHARAPARARSSSTSTRARWSSGSRPASASSSRSPRRSAARRA